MTKEEPDGLKHEAPEKAEKEQPASRGMSMDDWMAAIVAEKQKQPAPDIHAPEKIRTNNWSRDVR